MRKRSMTKYVVESGGISTHPDHKRRFHQEMIKGLGTHPHILFCGFAQLREDWNETFRKCQELVIEDMPQSTHPDFEMAIPDTFEQQCMNTDVIYLYGGDDYLLQYWMKQFDLLKIFGSKIVATNSASSNMLANSFWSCDWRKCIDGFGILPVRLIVHYLSEADDDEGPIDWQKAYNELEIYGDTSLPIHGLREGEFVVFNQP